MNIWENAVLTLKGTDLLAKLIEGTALSITRAEVGAGYITPGLLTQLERVTTPMQELRFRPVSYPESGKCKLPGYLTNDGLNTGYTATQVGVYAMDPDEGEILFFIVQATSGTGTVIPSESEMPGYSAEWSLYFQYGQADSVEVVVDLSNSVSREELNALDTIESVNWLDIDSLFGRENDGIYKVSGMSTSGVVGMESSTSYMLTMTNVSGNVLRTCQYLFDSEGKCQFRIGTGTGVEDWTNWEPVGVTSYNDLSDKPEIDETYNSKSSNAQSGKAVAEALASLVNSAPDTLNTLEEIAKALNDDPNFATTIINELAKKSNNGHTHTAAEIAETDALKFNRIVNITSPDGAYYAGTIDGVDALYEGFEIIAIANIANTSRTVYLTINNFGNILIRARDPISDETLNPYLGMIGPTPTKLRYHNNKWIIVDFPYPYYRYGTTDLTAGESELTTGALYFVYE